MNKIDEELFKEKARNYLLCYNTSCERREHCLHWLAGPYVPETDKVCTVVNMMNKDVREGNCPFYKSDEKITMKFKPVISEENTITYHDMVDTENQRNALHVKTYTIHWVDPVID